MRRFPCRRELSAHFRTRFARITNRRGRSAGLDGRERTLQFFRKLTAHKVRKQVLVTLFRTHFNIRVSNIYDL